MKHKPPALQPQVPTNRQLIAGCFQFQESQESLAIELCPLIRTTSTGVIRGEWCNFQFPVAIHVQNREHSKWEFERHTFWHRQAFREQIQVSLRARDFLEPQSQA